MHFLYLILNVTSTFLLIKNKSKMRLFANVTRRSFQTKLNFNPIRSASSASTDAAKPDIEHSILSQGKLWEIDNRTSLQFTLSESHGVLNKALNILTSNQINMTRISSKPSKFIENNWRKTEFFIYIEGTLHDNNVKCAIS